MQLSVFFALVMLHMVQTATPVLHEARTRCSTPCGVGNLHNLKVILGCNAIDALIHTHTGLHCLHVVIVRSLKQ